MPCTPASVGVRRTMRRARRFRKWNGSFSPVQVGKEHLYRLLAHKKYGVCTVGGFDRKRQTISLHAYRTNRRLTQGARVKDCLTLTWVAFRSWLVVKEQRMRAGPGGHPARDAINGGPISSRPVHGDGSPQADLL